MGLTKLFWTVVKQNPDTASTTLVLISIVAKAQLRRHLATVTSSKTGRPHCGNERQSRPEPRPWPRLAQLGPGTRLWQRLSEAEGLGAHCSWTWSGRGRGWSAASGERESGGRVTGEPPDLLRFARTARFQFFFFGKVDTDTDKV